MIGTSLYVLHSIFPDISWFATIRLEYLSLTLGVALFSRYFQSVYPKDANKYIVKCGGIHLPVLFTGNCGGATTGSLPKGIMPFLVVMFLYIGFAFYSCIRAVKFKRVGAPFALMSCAVMLMVF